MLLKLGDQIRECYERAADARAQANATSHPIRKQEFLDMERRWLFLARGYELSERIAHFTLSMSRERY